MASFPNNPSIARASVSLTGQRAAPAGFTMLTTGEYSQVTSHLTNNGLVNTSSQQVGVQNNSTNYYCLTTITKTSTAPYAGATVELTIYGQGGAFYIIHIYGYVNGTSTAWDNVATKCNVYAPYGIVDGDEFLLIPSFTLGTVKLYLKHTNNSYNVRVLDRVAYFTNSATVDVTYDSVGISTTPVGDF